VTAIVKRAREAMEGVTEGPWVAELDVFNGDEGIVASVSNARTDILFTAGTDFGIDTTPLNAPWTQERADKLVAEWAKAKVSQELRDARFIAASRTLVPEFVARVEKLEALLAEALGHWEAWAAFDAAPRLDMSEQRHRLAAIRKELNDE
jgi:hypothetical protein